MNVRIVIDSEHVFKTATKAMKFMVNHKAQKITFNNELVTFRTICELHQLELAEKRHNKAQGL
jgi:hypothetical protein